MAISKISVVMPNYNDADYIATSLKAICEQSYPPYEVIVIDDGSTDNSVQVIEELKTQYPMIRLLRNEQNRGTNFGINRGAAEATGDLICFPSANDQILPGLFEKSVKLLEKHPQAALCCTDMHFINVSDGSTYRRPPNWLPEAGYLSPDKFTDAVSTSDVPHPHIYTAIIRRDMLFKGVVYKPELEWYADWFLVQVLALRHGCCYIPEPLALFRWLDRGYVYSGLQNRQKYHRVYSEIIRLLASAEFEDVTPAMIKGRCLRFVQLHTRTPLLTWQAIQKTDKPNKYANALLLSLSKDYLKESYGPKAMTTFCQNKLIAPCKRAVHETKGLLKNFCDRIYARTFQKYDQMRSFIRNRSKSAEE